MSLVGTRRITQGLPCAQGHPRGCPALPTRRRWGSIRSWEASTPQRCFLPGGTTLGLSLRRVICWITTGGHKFLKKILFKEGESIMGPLYTFSHFTSVHSHAGGRDSVTPRVGVGSATGGCFRPGRASISEPRRRCPTSERRPAHLRAAHLRAFLSKVFCPRLCPPGRAARRLLPGEGPAGRLWSKTSKSRHAVGRAGRGQRWSLRNSWVLRPPCWFLAVPPARDL